MTVTFFGHSKSPQSITDTLEKTIIHLIEQHGASVFYIGTHGNFDKYANLILNKLSKQYSHIKCNTVLAYMPQSNELPKHYNSTILPESVAESHPKYAISKRNEWMLNECDTVVAYVTHQNGGASKYYQKAIRLNKTVVNIATINKSS